MTPLQYILKALHKLYVKTHPWNPSSGLILDPETVSEKIASMLLSEDPCMICRYGSTELINVTNYMSVSSGRRPVIGYVRDQVREWWWNEKNIQHMSDCSGFFPNDIEHLSRFGELILKDTGEIDMLGSWVSYEKYIEHLFPEGMERAPLRFLEPFWSKKPWTKTLGGKKVLVVHPFASLIEDQYRNKRQLLFSNPDILPSFDLKVLEAVQSLGGAPCGFQDWFEALAFMEDEIDKMDYDICLIGCGAYGFPLAAHVKRMGKKAVHLGGSLQLLFGIIGKRWEDPMYGVKEWGIPVGSYSSLMNEYWVRPGVELKPACSDKVEGGCYW